MSIVSPRSITLAFHGLVLAGVVAVCGCGDDDDDVVFLDGGLANAGTGSNSGRDAGSRDGGTADAGTEGANLSDPQVAGVMQAANAGEVQQGELAMDKAVDNAVESFATRMVEEHGNANQRLQDLLDEEDLEIQSSALRQQLMQQSMMIIEDLEDEAASGFDLAYMRSQRMVHMRVLAIIDSTLLPSVENRALRTELQAMRTTVSAHLERAEEILDDLTDMDAGR